MFKLSAILFYVRTVLIYIEQSTLLFLIQGTFISFRTETSSFNITFTQLLSHSNKRPVTNTLAIPCLQKDLLLVIKFESNKPIFGKKVLSVPQQLVAIQKFFQNYV